ncbi:MAG: DAK2 domain-containing protein [Cellulomonas sp.]
MERLDGAAVEAWAVGAANALEAVRGPIDSLNVFPVADADTGTNLYLTVAQGADEVVASGPHATALDAMRSFARGALLGARGNSGVIASQFLLGLAQELERDAPDGAGLAAPDGAGLAAPDGAGLARALDVAQASARSSVACPVEGTILTAASASAAAARSAADAGGGLAATALAALAGAREALVRTPDDLAVLRAAGVVDAGATGLVVILEALVVVLTGRPAPGGVPIAPRVAVAPDHAALVGGSDGRGTVGSAGPRPHAEFEVMFVVESDAGDVAPELSRRLQAFGESVAVVGGEGVWQAHVHTDDPAGAVAAGAVGAQRQITVRLLRPHAIDDRAPLDPVDAGADGPLGLVVGTCAPGLVRSLARTGAVVMVLTGVPGDASSVLRAVVDTGALQVAVLPGSPAACTAALGAAALATVRVHVFDAADDMRVVAGLAAAVAARSAPAGDAPGGAAAAELAAIRRAVGDVRTAELAAIDDGMVDAAAARTVADELLAAGGEVLTLLRGAGAGDATMDALLGHLAGAYPALEVVVLDGGQAAPVVAMAIE